MQKLLKSLRRPNNAKSPAQPKNWVQLALFNSFRNRCMSLNDQTMQCKIELQLDQYCICMFGVLYIYQNFHALLQRLTSLTWKTPNISCDVQKHKVKTKFGWAEYILYFYTCNASLACLIARVDQPFDLIYFIICKSLNLHVRCFVFLHLHTWLPQPDLEGTDLSCKMQKHKV